jgi:hypothetical protein
MANRDHGKPEGDGMRGYFILRGGFEHVAKSPATLF